MTIAAVWALAYEAAATGNLLKARESFLGLAAFAVVGVAFIAGCYLIARAVDARATRQQGQKVRRP